MDTTINERVRSLVQGRGIVQKTLAAEIGMTTDALSRALGGYRGFSALELARVAELLDVNVYELITGEQDPAKVRVAARHSFDHDTGTYSNGTFDSDDDHLEDIRLAYVQAYPKGDAPASVLPDSPDTVRGALGEGFVRRLADLLEQHLGVDVVRIPKLGTAYSMMLGNRAVIVVPASGNWFRENWDIAHELGHLVDGSMGVGDVAEAAANAFAASLLLPESQVRAVEWRTLTVEALGELVWDWGVSTDALRRRLSSLNVAVPAAVGEWLSVTTPQLLRGRSLPAARWGDLIARKREAAARRFPTSLINEHERAIAEGRLGKGTLAWMLGVEVDELEVAEPELRRGTVDELAGMLGLTSA
ncbi:helix-turn-helix domain-containing protein [Sanguibacter suaedae]|uniref:ImmA/IrrE family metallo-endopeptidase n=1 Tax=Sanguibacter suaedae TaxID=2795737 RepID=A0A934I7T4_9MICO|nr:XRE family transcriptional regulator [Sanguibacter suaedae]MBI9113795.1 ImmA/IrrE family metallo-endopeptidase [Sanguibacter suaedae]